MELSVAQAKRLKDSLETAIRNTEDYNRRNDVRPDPLDGPEE